MNDTKMTESFLTEALKADKARKKELLAKKRVIVKERTTILRDLLIPTLIREQSASRKARLGILTKEEQMIERELQIVAQRQQAKKGRIFEPVTIPGNWYIGYVERLLSRKRKIVAICIFFSIILVPVGTLAILLPSAGEKIGWSLFVSIFLAMIGCLVYSSVTFMRPHSVFKGTIPVKVLTKYREVKEQRFFDDIVVASPDPGAFAQLGRRTDPVLIGILFPVDRANRKVAFRRNGESTSACDALSSARLFEIARWDTAKDLEANEAK